MTAPLILNARWAKFKRSRMADMIASGVPVDKALIAATGEARARQRVSRIIGPERAEEAEVDYSEDANGRPQFGLRGAMNGLTIDQFVRLCRELGVTVAPA